MDQDPPPPHWPPHPHGVPKHRADPPAPPQYQLFHFFFFLFFLKKKPTEPKQKKTPNGTKTAIGTLINTRGPGGQSCTGTPPGAAAPSPGVGLAATAQDQSLEVFSGGRVLLVGFVCLFVWCFFFFFPLFLLFFSGFLFRPGGASRLRGAQRLRAAVESPEPSVNALWTAGWMGGGRGREEKRGGGQPLCELSPTLCPPPIRTGRPQRVPAVPQTVPQTVPSGWDAGAQQNVTTGSPTRG